MILIYAIDSWIYQLINQEGNYFIYQTIGMLFFIWYILFNIVNLYCVYVKLICERVLVDELEPANITPGDLRNAHAQFHEDSTRFFLSIIFFPHAQIYLEYVYIHIDYVYVQCGKNERYFFAPWARSWNHIYIILNLLYS